jgi:hypothetical protein
MRHRLLSINIMLHNPILIDPQRSQDIKRLFITGTDPIKDKTHHDLLPRRPSFIPKLRLL